MRRASMMLPLAAFMLAAAPVGAAPLEGRLSAIVSELCSAVVADPAILPPPGAQETGFFGRYSLEPGTPQAARDALGDMLNSTLSETRFASGTADDGAFVVFIDRDQSEWSCGAIVYQATNPAGLAERVQTRMTGPSSAWRKIASPDPKLLGLAGPGSGRPRQLIMISAPAQPDPTKLFMALEALSPNVALPEGF